MNDIDIDYTWKHNKIDFLEYIFEEIWYKNDEKEMELVLKKIAKSECSWLLQDLLPAAATSATTVGLRVLFVLNAVDVHRKDDFGKTALFYAVERFLAEGHPCDGNIKLLLKRGASLFAGEEMPITILEKFVRRYGYLPSLFLHYVSIGKNGGFVGCVPSLAELSAIKVAECIHISTIDEDIVAQATKAIKALEIPACCQKLVLETL